MDMAGRTVYACEVILLAYKGYSLLQRNGFFGCL